MNSQLDLSSVLQPLDPEEVKRKATQMEEHTKQTTLIATYILLPLLAGAIPLTAGYASDAPDKYYIALGLAAAAVIGIFIMTRTSTYSLREEADRRLRLARLAEANNITYTEDVKNLSYPGLLFDDKYGVTVTQRLQIDHENDIEVGNYRTSSSNDRYSKDGGYIRIKLKKHMPHILLFGQEFSDFEETQIVGSQKVSLEGDFDRHFRLYVPTERHRDVRYMFTPDFMALLIDSATAYDVEIIDDQLFVYKSEPFNLLYRKEYEKIFQIIAALKDEMTMKTQRYSDMVVRSEPANGNAEKYKRLRSSYVADIKMLFGVMIAFAITLVVFIQVL